MSLKVNNDMDVVIDRETLGAISRLLGSAYLAEAYATSNDIESMQEYLHRLHERAQEVEQLFQFNTLKP